MQKIDENLTKVTARLHRAARQAGRHPSEIQLVAVSKTHPAEALAQAWRCGQRRFGESYLQEALTKQAQLAALVAAEQPDDLEELEWHFIGPIQSNKTRAVAQNFAWAHCVDREKIARRLSEQRPSELPPLQVCLQINIDQEASKAGLSLDGLPALAHQVAALPRLQLRGLMALPAASHDTARQRASFARVRRALEALRAEGLALDTLSMGMSGDLEAAVAEGTTLVRVGTDIFGARLD